MAYKVITKEDFAHFVVNLLKEREVVGVKRKNGKYAFDKIGSFDELCLDYDVTYYSPKKYFLPPRETLLKYYLGEEIKVEAITEAPARVIIGVHPYDIKAIELMDEVFSGTNPDFNYVAKRQNSVVIGVDCLNPSPNSFCPSMGTATVETGFDLFLTDIGKTFVVAIGSTKGGELLGRYASTTEATAEDMAKRKAVQEQALNKYQLSLDVSLDEIPRLLERNYNHPLWTELGEKCLGCGSCTLVCPTCVCFDVQDEIELDLIEGERYRQWDSCLLVDFAKVATGENFRKDRPSRLRHRLFRKGKYMMERFGKVGCVGCGRCITACLAEISSPVEAYKRLKGGS